MSPMKLCSRDSSMRSVREGGAAAAGRIDPEALQLLVAARTAGLEPHLVETQHVAVAVRAAALTYLVERIHHGLELARQLREHVAEHAAAPVLGRLRQRAVGAAAHGDVIVDVDQLG